MPVAMSDTSCADLSLNALAAPAPSDSSDSLAKRAHFGPSPNSPPAPAQFVYRVGLDGLASLHPAVSTANHSLPVLSRCAPPLAFSGSALGPAHGAPPAVMLAPPPVVCLLVGSLCPTLLSFLIFLRRGARPQRRLLRRARLLLDSPVLRPGRLRRVMRPRLSLHTCLPLPRPSLHHRRRSSFVSMTR